jgi:hypothetical protein
MRQGAIARVAGFEDILVIRTWGSRPRNYEAGSPGVVWKLDNIQL